MNGPWRQEVESLLEHASDPAIDLEESGQSERLWADVPAPLEGDDLFDVDAIGAELSGYTITRQLGAAGTGQPDLAGRTTRSVTSPSRSFAVTA